MCEPNYAAQPSENGVDWYVWNTRNPPPKPIFIGSMEECGMVAGQMNAAAEGDAE